MNKIFVLIIFGFIFVSGIFSQSKTIFEHSNDFIEIHEQFKQRVYEISEEFTYFNAGIETKYLPVLDENDKEIIENDKFFILWLPGSDLIDLNFLFLCNNEAKEAIVFAFFKENHEDNIPITRGNITLALVNFLTSKLGDPKWFQK